MPSFLSKNIPQAPRHGKRSILTFLLMVPLLLAAMQPAWAVDYVAIALPRLQLFDAVGHPLAGGKLDTYAAGTTTPLPSYTDSSGATPNTNPVIADSGGYMAVYLPAGTAYKLRVRTAADVVLTTVDGITLQPFTQNTLEGINDISANSTAGNLTSDPGELGSEILATTAATELLQLRHVILEMKGTGNWRNTYATRTRNVVAISQGTENATWTAAGTTAWNFKWLVPDGWQPSSTMTLFLLRRSSDGVGSAIMSYTFARVRDNDFVNPTPPADVSFTPGETKSHAVQIPIPGTNFQAGDGVIVSITRSGDLGGDTMTGTVIADMWFVSFTGVASR